MSDIFISYSRSDLAKARMLATGLEREGWSVWWDPKITPGKEFDEVIEQELEKANCVIVLWSKASVASKWVRTEASEANRRGILVPVQIENDAKVPLAFRLLQASQLTDWQGQPGDPQFAALKSAVANMLGVQQPLPEWTDTERRKTLAASAAAPQQDSGKGQAPELKVGRRAPVHIPGFRNSGRHRFWILGVASMLLVASVIFIWMKSRGTSATPQAHEVAAPAQPVTLPDPKPPADDGQKKPRMQQQAPPQTKNRLATSNLLVVDGDLTWTRTDNGKDIDWNDANQYCKELTLGGLSRWRLPTIDELAKLYDPTTGDDYHIRKPFRLTDWWAWSSTKPFSGSAFAFGFGYGERDVNPLGDSGDFRVLCVRRSGE